MRIAVVTGSVSRLAGGFFHSVRRLHQCLAQLPGVGVEVLTLEDAFTTEDLPLWAPLPVRTFACRGPRQFGFSPRLTAALGASEVDLVHSHGIWMHSSMSVAAWQRRTRRPCVISPRGMMDPWALSHSRWRKRLAGWLFENANLRNAACLHALCESEARAIRAYGLKNPVAIIPNGMDLPPLLDGPDVGVSASAPRTWQRGRKVLLYLGRLHPKKGLVNLLRAWNIVAHSQPSAAADWVLAVAGWDQAGHEAELKNLAGDLGLSWWDARTDGDEEGKRPESSVAESSSVVFLGPQFDVAKTQCYRMCDGFILPSLSEGLPMVVLEAWAWGKPVLMTPECNLPEGFEFDAAIRIEATVESIAAGLGELFSAGPDVLRTLGANGRELVARRFAWPKIAADMQEVYTWALGGGPKPDIVVTVRP